MQKEINALGSGIRRITRNGVSESQLAAYVIGTHLSGNSTKTLFDEVVQDGLAEAALIINQSIGVSKPSPKVFKSGMPHIIHRARNGYSEETVGRIVLLSDGQQELYDSVVEHGLVDAMGVVLEEIPGLMPSKSEISYTGLARVASRVRNGYTPEKVDEFINMARLPNSIVQQTIFR